MALLNTVSYLLQSEIINVIAVIFHWHCGGGAGGEEMIQFEGRQLVQFILILVRAQKHDGR